MTRTALRSVPHRASLRAAAMLLAGAAAGVLTGLLGYWGYALVFGAVILATTINLVVGLGGGQ